MGMTGRRGLRPELRIARRIVTLRMLEGMSRADLARAAQIPEGRTSEIEQGIGRPRGKELFQLAAALNVDFGQLTADITSDDVAEPNGKVAPAGGSPGGPALEESLLRLRGDIEFQDLVKQLAVRVAKQ